MARRAIRDTYAYEQVSHEVSGKATYVRRLVRAGQFVPDTFVKFEDDDAFADAARPISAGLGAGIDPANYQHQRGVSEEEQVQIRATAKRGRGKAVKAATPPDGGDSSGDQSAEQPAGDNAGGDPTSAK